MKRLVGVGALALMGLLPTAATAQFTDWSAPVNLGPTVNSPYLDNCVTTSKDGLTLIFSSNRHTLNPTSGDRDLYVSTRATIEDAWGAPSPLTVLNYPGVFDSCPALSLDEHKLYFSSARPGGCGQMDLYVSRRQDRRDAFGWELPVNLGCEEDGFVNSSGLEQMPALFEDETGTVVMYLLRSGEIYESRMRDDDTFGPATPVVELNSAAYENGATVRRDGLEVIFQSNRDASSQNFWMATRTSTADPWSAPVFVPSLGNPALSQGKISLSFDGRELYFNSRRDGGSGSWDLWVARRERLPGGK